MKANILNKEYTGKIAQNRKEKTFYMQYTVVTPKHQNIIELRLYGTNRVTYACIWIHDYKTEHYICGGGRAGGYGYHKASAAVDDAINDAGIVLSKSISGRGSAAIEEALHAIAGAMGYKKVYLYQAHA